MFTLKTVGVWLLLVVVAVGNGLLREYLLVRWMGDAAALPVSGILLSVLVVAVSYGCLPLFGRLTDRGYLQIGLIWVLCTLFFEFGVGHYVANKSWQEIWQVFNITKGNLFSLVLLVTFLAPWLSARLRWKIPPDKCCRNFETDEKK